MTIDVNPQVCRYGHPLPHQSLATRRDLHARTINERLGQVAHGVTLTDEQVDQRRTGRGPSRGLPYRHLVYMPGSYGTSWTAFYTAGELTTFAAAYGLDLQGTLEPGTSLTLTLPVVPVESFAVVATDRRHFHSDVFATVAEAEAEMLRLFPADGPFAGEVPVAVASLERHVPYWRTIAAELAPA